eukprot:scaffold263943_cov32-Prasinocladus_malaysianus.AAC.1
MVAIEHGWAVTGSDQCQGDRLDWVGQAGGRVVVGHDSRNLYMAADGQLPDVVVVSSAVPEQNVELQAAKAASVPVLRREMWLKGVTAGYK